MLASQSQLQNRSFELPLTISYAGLGSALPAGWQIVAEPAMGDVGGQLQLMIPGLVADDGNPGSGSDEGEITVWTQVIAGTQNGAEITNCATATPEIGQGATGCVSTATPQLNVFKSQNGEDRNLATSILDVNPGDVFSYLMTATNVFGSGMYLHIFDALDSFVTYAAGSFRVNGATASDTYFAGDLLDYHYADLVNPGETLTLAFDVVVNSNAPDSWRIRNQALLTAYTNSLAPWGSAFVTIPTNVAEAQVQNPNAGVPEPSTLLLIAVGLLSLYRLGQRQRRTRK